VAVQGADEFTQGGGAFLAERKKLFPEVGIGYKENEQME